MIVDRRHIFFFWGPAALDMDNGNFHKIMIKRNTGGWVTPNKINISNGYTSSFKTKSKNTLSKAKSHEPFLLFTNLEAWKQGWAGKAFWLPGTGREIENHIPFYGKGTGIRKCYGKGNLRLVIPGNPGNHIKSKDFIYFYALTSHPQPKQILFKPV